MFAIDAATPFGARAVRRLETEQVIWMTTNDDAGTPQSFPVWFVWDGATILIYTEPGRRRLRNLARSPRAGFHFNTSADGEDVVVLSGHAAIDPAAPTVADNPAYLDKYREGIVTFGMPVDKLSATFSVPVRFIPEKLSGH